MTDFHWQPWFAWYPVFTAGPTTDTRAVVWFERVERRRVIQGRRESWQHRVLWNSTLT